VFLATNKKFGCQTDTLIFGGSFDQMKKNIKNPFQMFFPGRGYLESMQAVSQILEQFGKYAWFFNQEFPKIRDCSFF
jgi:hypothetical protein